MSAVFKNRDFYNLHDYGSGALLSDLVIQRCHFVNCVLSMTRDPARRSVVRDASFIDCTATSSSVGTAILKNVRVHNLRFGETLHACGTAFHHVVLSGQTGEWIISPLYDGSEAEIRPINDANVAFYANVDWALDIRELECTDFEVNGIPGRLILRDPETQALVRRENVTDERRWRDLKNTCWAYHIGGMIDDGAEDCILVAGKRSDEFNELLNGIELLRSEGIADPD